MMSGGVIRIEVLVVVCQEKKLKSQCDQIIKGLMNAAKEWAVENLNETWILDRYFGDCVRR